MIETSLIDTILFCFPNSNDDFSVIKSVIPISFLKNSPNPFNPNTNISFELKEPGQTVIEIYNIKGERIKTLQKSIFLEKGLHNIFWNGIDDSGKFTSSGYYFYKISINGKQRLKKMLLLK